MNKHVEEENGSQFVPKISVLMLAYNQAQYIDEAIAGVMRQRCPYAFELVIADDASTDETGERCRRWQARYPQQIVYLRNEQNVGLAQNFYDAYHRLRGEYVAICEGDDYWLSKHKLRRQVEWLEVHLEYVCCYHRVVNYVEETGEKSLSNGGRFAKRDIALLDLAACNYITNVSAVFRRSCTPQLPEWFRETPTYDYALHLLNAEHGLSHFMSRPMAVYRHHQGAAWSTAGKLHAAKISVGVRGLLIDHFAAKGREDVCECLRPVYLKGLADLQKSQPNDCTDGQPNERTGVRPRRRNPIVRALSRLIPLPRMRKVPENIPQCAPDTQ